MRSGPTERASAPPDPSHASVRYAGHGVGPRGGWRYAVGAEAWGAADKQVHWDGCLVPLRLNLCHPIPRFSPCRPHAGLSDADWPSVAAFYAYWGSFSSVKDFAWADQYHTGQAPNRKVCCHASCVPCLLPSEGRCNAWLVC